jgi:putative oxidoreductase
MNPRIKTLLRYTVAILLVQTLRYKFLAHPDSVYIFETIGMEPFGRIGIGVLELITALLLLIKRTAWFGAFMSIGLMIGALFFHLTILGIEVQGDGGTLFGMAILTWVLSLLILWNEQKSIPFLK